MGEFRLETKDQEMFLNYQKVQNNPQLVLQTWTVLLQICLLMITTITFIVLPFISPPRNNIYLTPAQIYQYFN